jgi:hypothetical protein
MYPPDKSVGDEFLPQDLTVLPPVVSDPLLGVSAFKSLVCQSDPAGVVARGVPGGRRE